MTLFPIYLQRHAPHKFLIDLQSFLSVSLLRFTWVLMCSTDLHFVRLLEAMNHMKKVIASSAHFLLTEDKTRFAADTVVDIVSDNVVLKKTM
jgi:hypothetical protein